MSYLDGTLTVRRFNVDGQMPDISNFEAMFAMLSMHTSQRPKLFMGDGREIGFAAGTHVTDTQFTYAKNIRSNTLYVQMIVKTIRVPAELKTQLYETDLAALSARNPSGFPTKMNKREAMQAAVDRIEEMARDGRWDRRAAVDVVYDWTTNEVYLGTASEAAIEPLQRLMKLVFNVELYPIDTQSLVMKFAEEENLFSVLDHTSPTKFVRMAGESVVWCPSVDDRKFFGNEFLIWLWYQCEDESAEITLLDMSKVTVFMSKRLTLECPLGRGGHESITHEGPTRLPEALRAIQSGKLPRCAGLTIVHNYIQFELVLNPETQVITGARLPRFDGDSDPSAEQIVEYRVDMVRALRVAINGLFEAFFDLRLSDEWAEVSARISRWLERE